MKTTIQQSKRVMKYFSFFILLFSLSLASCNRDDSHITLPNDPENPQGGVITGLNTDKVTNKVFNDTHLYGFDVAGKMILHKYYPTQKELSNDMFQMNGGAYTFIAVLNVGEAFGPETRVDMPLHNVTMNQFMSYVKRSEDRYPNMLTGMISRIITNNKIERIQIPLFDKSGGIVTVNTIIKATITLPDAEFEAYQRARSKATSAYNLRGVMEFFNKNILISRTVALLTPTATAGKYTMTAEVADGDYDMALWVDYTAMGSQTDVWYNTESLKAIKLKHDNKSYTSGSDSREVFYYAGEIKAGGGELTTDIITQRPQAKYVIVSNDIVRYKELMRANPEKYVPFNDLSVSIIYEGYLPCGFNVLTGAPNDSDTGFKTNKNPLPAVGATDTSVKIGSDYVFVNGTESSVTITILVTDKTGRVVSRVTGVKIDYKRNKLTTITGDFLTAGVINPGINIDTDWDDVYEVEF